MPFASLAESHGAIYSTMFMVFRNSWAYLFNNDEAVVANVAWILPIVSLFQVFDGLGAVTAGILRSIGKQFTGALLNLRSGKSISTSLQSLPAAASCRTAQ